MFVPSIRDSIISLHQGGFSNAEIARHLGIAPTTVSYHVGRAHRERASSASAAPEPPPAAVHRSRTQTEVARLLLDGLKHVEIARRLGVSKATVTYHVQRLGHEIDARFARRYDWVEIQRYYDRGHSMRDCIKVFGFSSATWSDAVKRGAIVPRPSSIPMSALLVAGTYRGRHNVKIRLLREGLKGNRCERCDISEWCGAPLGLDLHHINGDRLDNRLENLQLLCPNCHSQTNTFAGRNGRGRTDSTELMSP